MFSDRRATLSALYWFVVATTALGLVAGVYYRELTRSQGFHGQTQLSILHTHLLTLGMVVGLVLLVLEKVFHLSADRRLPVFFLVYVAGLTVTTVMMTVKGTLQVLDPASASGPALAGIAGLGHILLTLALVVLLMILKGRIGADDDATPTGTVTGDRGATRAGDAAR